MLGTNAITSPYVINSEINELSTKSNQPSSDTAATTSSTNGTLGMFSGNQNGKLKGFNYGDSKDLLSKGPAGLGQKLLDSSTDRYSSRIQV